MDSSTYEKLNAQTRQRMVEMNEQAVTAGMPAVNDVQRFDELAKALQPEVLYRAWGHNIANCRWSDSATPAEVAAVCETEVAAELAARRRFKRDELKEAGFPEFHLQHVFDVEPQDGDALKAVRKFMAGKETFLLLLGGIGTRKTGAAVWGASRSHGWANFTTADKLQDAFRYGDEADKLRADFESADVLVIDDLGTQFTDGKGFFDAGFNALMNHRYESTRKTIVTANITVDDFRKLYPRITDRIKEVGTVVIIGGASQRKKGST
jgi:DNA replication protein DnaC